MINCCPECGKLFVGIRSHECRHQTGNLVVYYGEPSIYTDGCIAVYKLANGLMHCLLVLHRLEKITKERIEKLLLLK
jgi:hypothetical protein